MTERIYYYKHLSPDGVVFRFSNGAVRKEAKAGEYLRMLRYAKKEAICLHPDNEIDYESIITIFGFPKGTAWQDIYNGTI